MDQKVTKKKVIKISEALFGLVVLLFSFIVLADFQKVKMALEEANWKLAVIAFIFALISCLATVGGYVCINKFLGIKVSGKKLFKIGFITITLNNLLTLGGVVGYGIRIALMRKKNVSTSEIIFASLYYSILNMICVSVFFAISLIYLLYSNILSENFELAIKIILAALPFFYFIILFLIFSNNFRKKFFNFLNKIFLFFKKKDMSLFFYQVDQMIVNGLGNAKKSINNIILPIFSFLVDWLFCIFSLWFCFLAFKVYLPLDLMVSGFFLGLSAGVISMIPGGLGVQELSLSAIYGLLGVSFSEAILIAILFRVIYYILPLFIGLLMYGKMISENKE